MTVKASHDTHERFLSLCTQQVHRTIPGTQSSAPLTKTDCLPNVVEEDGWHHHDNATDTEVDGGVDVR